MALKPSLLMTTSTFPIVEGDGVPRFVLDLASALTDEFDVTVLAPDARGAARDERIGEVRIHRFRYFWPRRLQRLTEGGVIAVNLYGWTARLQVPLFLVAQLLATRRWIRRSGAAVVNAHWLVPQGLTAAIACRTARTPLVVHAHAGDVYFLQRLPFGRSLARFVIGRSYKSLAAGTHVRDTLGALVGFDAGIALRPMGVHIDQFQRPTESGPSPRPSPYIVFVGRFVEKKGAQYLIEALGQVRVERPDMELVLIGSGPLEDALRERASSLGLEDVVQFVGARSHPEVIRFLHGAEVACVPSIVDSRGETDGMPTVVLEAMAAGTRVVGTAVDGIPDVLVHASNGWLAQPADSNDLANQLLAAVQDPRGGEVAMAGESTAAIYAWQQVGTEYSTLLRRAILAHDSSMGRR